MQGRSCDRRLRAKAVLFVLAIVALNAGCRKSANSGETAGGRAASAGTDWFADVTDKCGIHFIHDAGPLTNFFMPESVGSGCALFDYDNDGRLDIYLIQNGGANGAKNKLYHQEPDGTFKDVSAGSGLDVAGYGMGVAVGDVNNDGLPDVLVTEFGRIRLFLNQGGGHFRDVTREAGLEDAHWGTSAAFVDYDRDGWLDLVVANYGDYSPTQHCTDQAGRPEYCGPNAFPGTTSALFRNLGPGPNGVPRFDDVTARSGIGSKAGWGLGVVCADFDGDGWPDIFITNDAHPNYLWINQHDGTFKEEAMLRGIAYNNLGIPQANMGIAIGDVRGTGLIDLYVTHLTEEQNILWLQNPAGSFQDRTAVAGLASANWHATGFGTVFADLDNRGFPALAVANGRVRRSQLDGAKVDPVASPGGHWSPYVERNQLFANDGQGNFHDVSEQNPTFCGAPAVARALACGDIFNDGGLGLLVTNIGGPARLYRNVIPNRSHWLTVRAIDPALGGRDAYGAIIKAKADGRWHTGWVNPGYSYACSNDPRAHIGLANVDHVDDIVITWPDGKTEHFPGGPSDRVITLIKGGGGGAPATTRLSHSHGAP